MVNPYSAVIYGVTAGDPFDNCSAWTPRSYWHVFQETGNAPRGIRAGGITAHEYIEQLVTTKGTSAGPSYR